MTDGGVFIQYGGHNFPTIIEARWVVFFDALRNTWHYDAEAEWGLPNAPHHYQPQFFLPRIDAYLEVQRPGDDRIRRPMLHYHPETEEEVVYHAIGDLPDERQLATVGWWDRTHGRGVRNLTAGYEWGDWFGTENPEVLYALEVARDKEFESAIPLARPPDEEVLGIFEREREQRPE